MADSSVMMVVVDIGPKQIGRNHGDWRSIAFSNESSFQLCPDVHQKRVWRCPLQRSNPVFTIAFHTGPERGFMYPGLSFPQDNARPHMARVSINCLTACQTLSWTARSAGFSPIEHVWDIMGRRLHLPGNVDDSDPTFGANLARNTAVEHQCALSFYAALCGSLHPC
ncbi:transposable element Tc1 transposase [Trichonephila clavipes]|nr:transposable element Tc1 transposase [Trichonephila clavipes]